MVSTEAANAFLTEAFAGRSGRGTVSRMDDGVCEVRLVADAQHMRPGGYVSGPTQMALADTAAYLAPMTKLGILPMAVTTNLNINFLRPCIGDVVIATGTLMKLGRQSVITEVDIRIEGSKKPASHAIVTYALPQDR